MSAAGRTTTCGGSRCRAAGPGFRAAARTKTGRTASSCRAAEARRYCTPGARARPLLSSSRFEFAPPSCPMYQAVWCCLSYLCFVSCGIRSAETKCRTGRNRSCCTASCHQARLRDERRKARAMTIITTQRRIPRPRVYDALIGRELQVLPQLRQRDLHRLRRRQGPRDQGLRPVPQSPERHPAGRLQVRSRGPRAQPRVREQGPAAGSVGAPCGAGPEGKAGRQG